MVDNSYFESNFQAWIELLDGTAREFGELEEMTFDDLFHDDASIATGVTPLSKSDWQKIMICLLGKKVKAEILKLEFLDDSQVEYQVHLAGDGIDQTLHSTADIKSDKLLNITPIDETAYLDLSKISSENSMMAKFEASMRAYFGMFKGKPFEFGPVEIERYNNVFHDSYEVDMNGVTHTKLSWMEAAKGMARRGLKADFKLFKAINEFDAEYKVELTPQGGGKIVAHSVGTIKDGKIIATKPFTPQEYNDLADAMMGAKSVLSFEKNLKAFYELFDGTSWRIGVKERRCFNSLYHDDFRSEIDGVIQTKSSVLNEAKKMATDGVKAHSYFFKVVDDSRAEYSINTTSGEGAAQEAHFVGTVKNGKLIAIKPCDSPSKGKPIPFRVSPKATVTVTAVEPSKWRKRDSKGRESNNMRNSGRQSESRRQRERAKNESKPKEAPTIYRSSKSNEDRSKTKEGRASRTAPGSDLPQEASESRRQRRKASRHQSKSDGQEINDDEQERDEEDLSSSSSEELGVGAFKVVVKDGDDDGEEGDDVDEDYSGAANQVDNQPVVVAQSAAEYEEEMQAAIQKALEQGRNEGRQAERSNIVVAIAHEDTNNLEDEDDEVDTSHQKSSVKITKKFKKLFSRKK